MKKLLLQSRPEALKEKGYFKNVDKNELIKDIIENCEVV